MNGKKKTKGMKKSQDIYYRRTKLKMHTSNFPNIPEQCSSQDNGTGMMTDTLPSRGQLMVRSCLHFKVFVVVVLKCNQNNNSNLK